MHKMLQYILLLISIPNFALICIAEIKTDSKAVRILQEASRDEITLRSVINEYYSTLAKKDWNHLMTLGLETDGEYEGSGIGPNLCLEFLKRTLDTTSIERLEFEIGVITIKNNRATAHVSVSIKAIEAGTNRYQIDLARLKRKLLWEKTFSDPKNPSGVWKIRSDISDSENLLDDLMAVKSDSERKLHLIGSLNELGTLAEDLSEDAVKLAYLYNIAKSFKNFRLAQFIFNFKKEQDRFSIILAIKRDEMKMRQYAASGDRPNISSLMHSLGVKYESINDYENALEFLNKSLSLYTEDGNKEKIAELNKEIATVYGKKGQYQLALDTYTKSLNQYRAIISDAKHSNENFKAEMSEIVKNLGLLFQLQGQPAMAAKIYLEGLGLLLASDSSDYIIYLLISISNPLWMEGDTTKAFEMLDASLPDLVDSESDEKAEIMFTISFIKSLFYIMRGDFSQAAKHLKSAREQAGAMGEEEGQGALLQLFEGILYRAEGSESWGTYRMQESIMDITEMSKGLSLMDDNSEDLHLPDILGILARYFLVLNKQDIALQCYLESLEIAMQSGNDASLAFIYRQLGALYRSQGDDIKALEHLEKSLSFSKAHSPVLEENLSSEPMAYTASVEIADIYESRGDYVKAIESLKKVLEDKQRSTKLMDAHLYYELAKLHYAREDFNAALSASEKATVIALKENDLNIAWKTQDLSGLAHSWLDQWEMARQSFQSAIDTIEKNRTLVFGGEEPLQRFFEDKVGPYHHMISLLVSQNDPEKAFAFAEQSKSRVLLDTLSQGRNKLIGAMAATNRETEQRLREKLILLNRMIRQKQMNRFPDPQLQELRAERLKARLDYEIFRANFLGSHPGISKPSDNSRDLLSIERAAKAMPTDNSALLEYVVTEDKTYLFVLMKNSPSGRRRNKPDEPGSGSFLIVHKIEIDQETLENDVRDYRERVAHPDGIVEPLSRKLYELLVKPAEKQLAGKSTLVIVPDGVLWELPFQTLLNTNGRYLLQDYAICYEPSVSILQEVKERAGLDHSIRPKHSGYERRRVNRYATSSLTLLVIANPATENRSTTLPESERLAQNLVSLYGKRSKMLVNKDASEERVKDLAKYYQIIHFGIHGILDDDNPMYSHLVLYQGDESSLTKEDKARRLSDGKIDDGVLEAWELADMRLNSRLIVLTACETARGRIGTGEGMIGISWALFMASCPMAIVSQWKVEAESTSRLFFDFHKVYKSTANGMRNGFNVASAYKKAATNLMQIKQFNHPYYWGGFVVIGLDE